MKFKNLLSVLTLLLSVACVFSGNTGRWSWGWTSGQNYDPTYDIDISDNERYGTNSDPDKPVETRGWHLSDFFNSRFPQVPNFFNIKFPSFPQWPAMQMPELPDIQFPDWFNNGFETPGIPDVQFPTFPDFQFPDFSNPGPMCACPEDKNGTMTGSSGSTSWSFSWSWHSVNENGTESSNQNSTCRMSCSSVCQCDLLNTTLAEDQKELTEECMDYCTSHQGATGNDGQVTGNGDAPATTKHDEATLSNEPIVQMQPVSSNASD